MPRPDSRARGAREVIWWAVVVHEPIEGLDLYNDLWIVPLAVSHRTADALRNGIDATHYQALLVTYAGEEAALLNYPPAFVRVILCDPSWTRDRLMDAEHLSEGEFIRHRFRQQAQPKEIDGELVVLLRSIETWWSYADASQELTEEAAEDVSGAHPMAYWIERDLQLHVDEASLCFVRYRMEVWTLQQLRDADYAPDEEIIFLEPVSDDAFEQAENQMVSQGYTLSGLAAERPEAAPWFEAYVHGDLPPFRTPLPLGIPASRAAYSFAPSIAVSIANVRSLDLTKPRQRPFSVIFSPPSLLASD